MDEILIVDDEPSVVEVVSLYLKREGYTVRQAEDGQQALVEIGNRLPDLIVLDLMLPGVDGIEIMRRLRDEIQTDVPVIMLTARGQEMDRIYGLEMGADDYVTKPFSPLELVARIKAVIRRTKSGNEGEIVEQPIEYSGFKIDPTLRELTLNGQACELTATEFNLLWYMAKRPKQVFSRTQLLDAVWGFSEYVDPSTVTVHIRRLREKLESDPSSPRWLQTVWGVGYKFSPNGVYSENGE